MIALALPAAQDARPASLPDTPQGRHVAAWLEAFNSGDEKTFLTAQSRHMSKTVLSKRPDADRARMFQRMRGDFAALKVAKILKATDRQIQFLAPARDGGIATFTFDFEEAPPHLISGIGIDVRGPDGGAD
jgi:hypothetical protein